MIQQWVFIEPHDVWMFRDSKPFTAGESFFARSMFPPQPGTIQGMIRTHFYEHTQHIIGSSTSMGDLRITGAFLACKNGETVRRFYPMPLDVLATRPPRQLMPARSTKIVTDLGEDWRPLISSDPLPSSDHKPEKDARYWLDEANFSRYLEGKPPAELTSEKELYGFEERTGLAIDYNRRAYRRRNTESPEGLFYRAAFVRPQPTMGLLIKVEYPDKVFTSDQGAIAVGGESRMGNFTIVKYTPPAPRIEPGRIKLILLTPTYFTDGWQPSGGWSPWLGEKARLVSAAIDKPQVFSGWDMVAGRPKTLRHFIPAGSVYYFEDAVLPTAPLTETPKKEPDFGAIGYGAFAAAAWDYPTL